MPHSITSKKTSALKPTTLLSSAHPPKMLQISNAHRASNKGSGSLEIPAPCKSYKERQDCYLQLWHADRYLSKRKTIPALPTLDAMGRPLQAKLAEVTPENTKLRM